ncbi:MAG: hypothetical protein CM1200mP26_05030 [Acidimicrobiales bacterium]|nr:MAG: hypothetical protein CM1200mP26_05030 [Acidimicrobiales bacterium]
MPWLMSCGGESAALRGRATSMPPESTTSSCRDTGCALLTKQGHLLVVIHRENEVRGWPVEPPGLGNGPLSNRTRSVHPRRAKWPTRQLPTSGTDHDDVGASREVTHSMFSCDTARGGPTMEVGSARDGWVVPDGGRREAWGAYPSPPKDAGGGGTFASHGCAGLRFVDTVDLNQWRTPDDEPTGANHRRCLGHRAGPWLRRSAQQALAFTSPI